jgi:hypothetical protein
MELADEKVEKPALFPSPSFNSVPIFFLSSPSLFDLWSPFFSLVAGFVLIVLQACPER